MSAPAYLVLAGSPQAAWVHPITAERTVIGREAGCHVHIAHPTVSRRHCEVWSEEVKVYAQDLGSLNGVYVNGTRVRRHRLASGDLLQVGPLVLQVVRALVCGESVYQLGVGPNVSTVDPRASARTLPLPNFTTVERQIIQLLADSHSEKEVAADLGLSPHTVHSHVKQIYRQLGISSRSELVAWYWRGQVD